MSSPDFSDLQPVTPVRPAAAWIGGKRLLSKTLVERINATPHSAYAEAFVGMGGVFLARDRRPSVEIINDFGDDVANFFRVLQRHYIAFLDMIRFQITSRSNFHRLVAQEPASLTDLERAARFIYLQRLTFGGKVRMRNFGVDNRSPARFDISKLGPLLEALHERLAGVTIERLGWSDFIGRYDRDKMLFYLDPPYWGSEDYYGKGLFARDDYTRMAELLAGIRGSFILSINDRPEIRELFAAFNIEPVNVTYSRHGGRKGKKFGELIISN